MLVEVVFKWWWDKTTFFSRVRCVCVSQCQVRGGGVSEGRDLIRRVRMGVCVWVRGVYLVKSSVGRRRWGFIKMNQPLPVSLSHSLTQHKTRMAPCCGLSKRQFNKLTHSHISSHAHEVSITNVGKTGKCILLWINETLLWRYQRTFLAEIKFSCF